jgi:hypothetical protein
VTRTAASRHAGDQPKALHVSWGLSPLVNLTCRTLADSTVGPFLR